MAKYASQPTLPTSPAFGAQPNNFSTFAPHRLGQALPALGAVPGAANPYTTPPQAAVGAPATAQGIMQTAQQAKTAGVMGEALSGGSVAELGMGKTPGRFAGDARSSLLRRWPCTKEAREQGRFVADSNAASNLTGLPTSLMDVPPYLKSARLLKLATAMAPMTAAPPAPPPPMPTPLGVQGMLPPGATPPGGPGAAPPPADPNMQPPPGAAPGAAPPGDPAAAGAPPPTLNGEVPPMGMPPTPPLPANPRVNPPRQATPQDFQRRQDLNQLLMMDEQASPENTVQSMQPDLLTMGSKSAFENFYAKCAASPLDDPELHARVDAMGPQVRNVFDRFQDVFADIWEKCAAQDNGPDQYTVQRSATGESKGLSYQHKPDHYMQGQDAWESVSGYFKGGEKKKPNPFLGKHASCGDEIAFKRYKALGYSDEEADRLAGQPVEKQSGDAARRDNETHAQWLERLALPQDLYKEAFAPGGRKLFQGRKINVPSLWNTSGVDDLIGTTVTTKKPPLGGMVPLASAGAASAIGSSALSLLLRKRFPQLYQRSAQPEPGATAPGVTKQASMPNMGKGNAPQLKPGFDLKPPVGQLPYSPGAGVLQMNKNFLQLLKPPVTPPKLATPKQTKTAEDVFEKVAFLVQMLQGGLRMSGTAAKGAYRAARPTLSTLKNPMVQKHIRTNVAKSVGGGFAAGVTGDGTSGDRIGYGKYSVPFDWNRAMLGAAAFNPALNRIGRRGGNFQAPLFNGVRGDVMGSFTGMAGDTLAGWTGFDTGGAGQRWGSRLGTGLGVARGVGQFGQTLPQTASKFGVTLPTALTGPAAQRAFTGLRAGATRTLKPAAEFGNATDDALTSVVTYIPRQIGYHMRRFAPEGGRLSRTLDAWNIPTEAGNIPGMVSFFNRPSRSAAELLGRSAGALATGVGAAATGYGMMRDDATQAVGNGVVGGGADLYKALRPQMATDVSNILDTYLNDAGLLDEQGKVQLPMPQIGGKLMGMADNVFRQIGLDPSQMSPAQKISILGGTGLLGAGALSGNGGMAGVGTLMMGGGAMAGGEQSPLMQLLKHMPRNEFTSQLQHTGQAPNANPYGPTL